MSLHRLIQGTAFDPEIVELLSQAYEAAVKRVGKNQPVVVLETIAKRIIEIGGRGERNPTKIVEYAIRGVEPRPDGD
jgi:hypothetical protein